MILTLPFPQARGPVASTVYPAENDGAEFHFPEVIL